MSTFTGIGAALPRSLTVPAARPAADPTPPVPQSQPAVEPTARGKTIAEWLAFVERKPPAPTRHEYSAFRPAGRPLSEGSLRLRSSVAQERTAPPGTVEVFHGTVDARRAPDHRHESARPGVTEGFLSNVDPHRAPGRRTESARPGTVEDFLATVDPHRAPGCRNESARPRVVEDCRRRPTHIACRIARSSMYRESARRPSISSSRRVHTSERAGQSLRRRAPGSGRARPVSRSSFATAKSSGTSTSVNKANA